MTMTRIQPARELMSLGEAMDRVFSQSWPRFYATAAQAGRNLPFTPRADAWEDEDGVTIELALPGVDPTHVDVTFEKDSVVVSGELPARDDTHGWVIVERARGAFERRFHLNVPVKADEATAEFHNGILTLRLPKREESKPRKIAVQVTA
jgi:HSP20 family protein